MKRTIREVGFQTGAEESRRKTKNTERRESGSAGTTVTTVPIAVLAVALHLHQTGFQTYSTHFLFLIHQAYHVLVLFIIRHPLRQQSLGLLGCIHFGTSRSKYIIHHGLRKSLLFLLLFDGNGGHKLYHIHGGWMFGYGRINKGTNIVAQCC